MLENSLVKHVRKVNKTLNWVFFVLGFIMLIAGIVTQTIASSFISLLVTIGSAFVALFLRIKNKDTAASYVLVASALIQVLPLLPMMGSNAFILAMLPISVSALYLNKWIFIIVGSIMNVVVIIVHIASPDFDIGTYIFADVFQVLITIVLFVLVRAGGKLIKDAGENGAQAKNLLDELQKNIEIISTSRRLKIPVKTCRLY